MIYATYGAVEFKLGVIDTLSVRAGMSYAEHALIDSKPRLQCTGAKLLEMPIRAFLDIEFCTPRTAADALRTAMESKAANPFVLSNGTVLGDFVITDYSETVERTADDGTPLTLVLDLSLKEFFFSTAAKKNGIAVINSGQSLPINVNANSSSRLNVGYVNNMHDSLTRAASIGRQIAGGVAVVRNVLTHANNLRNAKNFSTAVNALRACTHTLRQTAQHSDMFGRLLSPLRNTLIIADRVCDNTAHVSSTLRSLTVLTQKVTLQNLPNYLQQLDTKLATTQKAWRECAIDLAKLAARGGVRGLQ